MSAGANPKVLPEIQKDVTLHLAKAWRGQGPKKRAPRCIAYIRKMAQRLMRTEEVRIDTKLNKFCWEGGIRSPPVRVRVRISRIHNRDQDAKESMYSYVQYLPVASFKGLQMETVESQ